MENIRKLLETRLREAFVQAGLPADAPAAVGFAQRPEFGDYQANGIMGAAKQAGVAPRPVAEQVLAATKLDDIAGALEVAGPGFINITLDDAYVARALAGEITEPAPLPESKRVVVDYSHPNLSKEMHIGHLRSTAIGDCIVRVLEHLGHTVIRQNHVGDWGTQFGMLIAHMQEVSDQAESLADLEAFYRDANAKFESDQKFADKARNVVVRLQSGDPSIRQLWAQFIDTSAEHYEEVYSRLGVSLGRDDIRGESAYNDDLPGVIDALDQCGLITESDGALCVFLDEFKRKDGRPLPVIVRKSDGGYLYTTTDLAAVRYRCHTLKADRVLYVVDSRQSLHLRQVFAVARAAGFTREGCELEHLPFGTILGTDGRPYKTRTGEAVPLADVLDEAEQRAFRLVTEKSPELAEDARRAIAAAVGIGAVKYSDLSKNRTSDYVFDWNQMLSLEGNTAPYLQYALTRIFSVFRRAALERSSIQATPSLSHPTERALGVQLLRMQEVLEQLAGDGYPHHLCSYLYDVAGKFMTFYEQCPILRSDEPVKGQRLMLAKQTAAVLEKGLELLGIRTVERM
jgi:arginyl-tRNA synthetase